MSKLVQIIDQSINQTKYTHNTVTVDMEHDTCQTVEDMNVFTYMQQ